jgi:hypothetical protein
MGDGALMEAIPQTSGRFRLGLGATRRASESLGIAKLQVIAGPPAHLHDPPPTDQGHHCLWNTSWHEASG